MDPAMTQVVVTGVIELLMLPLLIFVLKRTIGKRLDEFDQKRDQARQERGKQIEDDKKWQDAMTAGMRSMLRSELISEHRKWLAKGYAPLEAKEYCSRIFVVYHDQLGGNGIGASMYEEILSLPTKKEGDE